MLIKYNFLFGVLLHICVTKIYFGSLCVLTERCVWLTDIARALLNEKIYLGFERRKSCICVLIKQLVKTRRWRKREYKLEFAQRIRRTWCKCI